MNIRLPAEWERQSFIAVVFPSKVSDWSHSLKEIENSYIKFIDILSTYQKTVVLSDDIRRVKHLLKKRDNIKIVQIETNDTWIRDFGAISVEKESKIILYDFIFNAWGGKFESELDNEVNKKLFEAGFFTDLTPIDFVLEGGSIDSNGNGIMLTTSKCIFNKNRNPNLSKEEILDKLKKLFGLKKIIVLNHGSLIGDDTDSHIDTLARFVNENTIVYTKCYDKDDEHYEELSKMEKELQNTGFSLLPLPLPSKKIWNEKRLPATYINFVLINNAIIVPTYDDKFDKIAIETFKNIYPDREVKGTDASIFIREHGALHCASINFYNNLGKI